MALPPDPPLRIAYDTLMRTCMHVCLLVDYLYQCLAGKEYVCVIRLHDAIESEALLAQVSVLCYNVLYVMYCVVL